MNLSNLSDESLHNGNIESAREEREILTRNLHRLRETERRRLFSKYKCKLLFEYATKFMSYSDDESDRRIKAMHVLRDVPTIEARINSGALGLTNLAMAQKLFIQEKKSGRAYTPAQKAELLIRLENQTTRAVQKIVYSIRPDMKPKKNDLNFESIEDDVLREKLLDVKGRYAHTHPYMTLSELLHKLCDEKLAEKTKLTRARKVNPESKFTRAHKTDSRAGIIRNVWTRDDGRCVKCKSTHAVQVEHIIPKAAGWALDSGKFVFAV